MANETKYLSIQRKMVAEMTSKSWQEIPHVSFSYEPDITAIFDLYQKEIKPLGLSFNTLILRIIVEGLKCAKAMNAEIVYNYRLAGGKVITKDEISISMPMILPSGEMMTVTLRNVNDMSLVQLRNTIIDIRRRSFSTDLNEVMYDIAKGKLIERMLHGQIVSQGVKILLNQFGKGKARHMRGKEKRDYESIPATDRLTKKDLDPGTVTVSNVGSLYPGMRGSFSLLEILPGQVVAIGLGAVQDRATVLKDREGNKDLAARKIFPMCIAFDHRALDFNEIVPFIKRLDEIFEKPAEVLNWIS
ncbi:MAG: 2-oxo acid dehydrogenase subunit E2 [Clostridia bacterium]|nr:2-oxo acid dehydrogenase subunit E2 [Clostridia bacterium]